MDHSGRGVRKILERLVSKSLGKVQRSYRLLFNQGYVNTAYARRDRVLDCSLRQVGDIDLGRPNVLHNFSRGALVQVKGGRVVGELLLFIAIQVYAVVFRPIIGLRVQQVHAAVSGVYQGA